MYIKSMVLDGFKSYGTRTEIKDFDKEFNAITGLNGSGKSNILDGICFVLGISNLNQVRATSLQELVYKSGQTGVKSATVTLIFDNSNKKTSPIGYDQFDEITIARQVIIGVKNKYMINGLTVPNKRVQDLFCSVQLNVNNPHFLIMQGRITKVLNMKPMEVLSMVEEAAGTSMYEKKKQDAMKTIEKKESKLKETNTILNEEITPKLIKLREEKARYMEYQRVERELEHCRRIYVAAKYVEALKSSETAEGGVEKVEAQIEEFKDIITNGEVEVKNIKNKIDDITEKRDAEMGGKIEALELELKENEKKEHKAKAEFNSNAESINLQEDVIKGLKNSIKDDEKCLADKQKEIDKVGDLFQNLKDNEKNDAEALAAAQESYNKINAGLLESETGENATLEQQVINAKEMAAQAQTDMKKCEMGLKHNEEQLKTKSKEMSSNANEFKKDSQAVEIKERELKNLENCLGKMNYQEGDLEHLEKQRQELTQELRSLQDNVDSFESNYPNLRFNYRKPHPNFQDSSVKGLVCKLITIEDKRAAYALEVTAGGRLYNVIVDTEQTSKALLQHGQLQRRTTIIPLNKIFGRAIDQRTVQLAQNLVGAENVQPALACISFPEETRAAMTYIFGQTLICKDLDVAKKIAFHKNVMKKCVTLNGDVVDPAGTMSGGAMVRGGSILQKLDSLKTMEYGIFEKNNMLREVTHKIGKIDSVVREYSDAKKKYDLCNYELNMVRQRLKQTAHYQIKDEVERLAKEIEEMKERLETAKKQFNENSKRAKDLESQLKDVGKIREKQLKDAENKLKTLKKKAEASKREWEKREQEAETLNLEVKELKKSVEDGTAKLEKAEERLKGLAEKQQELQKNLEEITVVVENSQKKLKSHKDGINQHNKEIQKLKATIEDIIKNKTEAELEIRKLTHEVNAMKNNAKDCKNKVAELTRKYEWIENDKQYFGLPGGAYDFVARDPAENEVKMRHMQATYDRLSKSVNVRAINLLSKEEELYNSTTKRKKIIENDKKKLLETISRLDEQKKETLVDACDQVNRDFSSIFSTLLPGANAKLQPPENKTVIEGLEVKIGFSGVWKDSLGELSGGQRSLVALSLILAMLLFKPAPLYILDEVDAALDISHTENIGQMLKRHFMHSQFIVVSLKDGMFNNANVLFTTKFVDGMSTVLRKSKSMR